MKLSMLYFKGLGVEKDNKKVLEYLEISASLGNPMAYYNIGAYYSGIIEEEEDQMKAKEYFEFAAQKNHPGALFYIGYLYSLGIIIEQDTKKAIDYYERCINSENEIVLHENLSQEFEHISYYNKFRYFAYNSLGLIHLLIYNDIEKSRKCLMEAAFAEYQVGQNNYGLFNQFILNDLEKARHFYTRSAEHNFSLAEFNIAHILEKEGKTDESIEYFVKASEHENDQIIYKNEPNNDIRLENSKTFIICLANLKLSKYFLLNSNLNESKKYFIRSFAKINNSQYPFQIKINLYDTKNIFSSIKSFIFEFPSFSIENINSETNKNSNTNNISRVNELIFLDPKDLFDFAITKKDIKSALIKEITEIIDIMESKLYEYPYLILFGQMPIKQENEIKTKVTNINNMFYEGFGM